MFDRRNLPAVGVAAAAVALTAVSPVLASSGSAERVQSDTRATLIQNQATFKEAPGFLDGFDSCGPTTVLTHVVNAPRAGYLQVTGNASAARDTDNPNHALLRADVTVNGRQATPVAQTLLTIDGLGDGSVSTSGLVPVPQGNSTVRLRLSECEAGMAFVVERALLTEYHRFGKIAAPAPRVAGASNG